MFADLLEKYGESECRIEILKDWHRLRDKLNNVKERKKEIDR